MKLLRSIVIAIGGGGGLILSSPALFGGTSVANATNGTVFCKYTRNLSTSVNMTLPSHSYHEVTPSNLGGNKLGCSTNPCCLSNYDSCTYKIDLNTSGRSDSCLMCDTVNGGTCTTNGDKCYVHSNGIRPSVNPDDGSNANYTPG